MSVRIPEGTPAAGSPRDPAGADPDRLHPVAPADRPTGAAAAGPGKREPVGPGPPALRAFGAVLVAVAALGLAVVESFLVPLRIGTVPLPVSVLLAVAGNIALPRLAGRWTGSVLAAAVPPVLWLVVVVVLSLPRAEGDLIVPGTVTGLVFLLAGSVAGAFGAALTVTGRRNPTIAARG